MGTIPDSPLGKATRYPESYDAALLYPVERSPQREALGIAGALPFGGADRWTAWELAWLDRAGRPQVAMATFEVRCTSPRIVESKSVKLYLASLNHARFDSPELVSATLARDLSAATGSDVDVELDLPATWWRYQRREPAGVVIDAEPLAARPGEPDATVLRVAEWAADETLVSRTFRSVCPVTGQPDYACVVLAYRGATIDHAALAAYLFGYRRHPGFHEHCVERIFVDVWRACRPRMLSVEARFTRRGGLDINPWRASEDGAAPAFAPTVRQ